MKRKKIELNLKLPITDTLILLEKGAKSKGITYINNSVANSINQKKVILFIEPIGINAFYPVLFSELTELDGYTLFVGCFNTNKISQIYKKIIIIFCIVFGSIGIPFGILSTIITEDFIGLHFAVFPPLSIVAIYLLEFCGYHFSKSETKIEYFLNQLLSDYII